MFVCTVQSFGRLLLSLSRLAPVIHLRPWQEGHIQGRRLGKADAGHPLRDYLLLIREIRVSFLDRETWLLQMYFYWWSLLCWIPMSRWWWLGMEIVYTVPSVVLCTERKNTTCCCASSLPLKYCVMLIVLYCRNCPKDDKFRYFIPILRKLGAA